jgi:hypothetical protein
MTVVRTTADDPTLPALVQRGCTWDDPARWEWTGRAAWWRLDDAAGVPVGLASYLVREGEAWLDHFLIVPAARSWRALRTLIRAIEADVAAAGFRRLLTVVPIRAAAYRPLFARCGWQWYAETAEHDCYARPLAVRRG